MPGLTIGLIIGGVIVYSMAMAIPLGKPNTLTEAVVSTKTSLVQASMRVAYVSLMAGAGTNKSAAVLACDNRRGDRSERRPRSGQ